MVIKKKIKNKKRKKEKKAEDSRNITRIPCKRKIGFRTTRVIEKQDPKRRG